MAKKILVITYYWPPSGGPGVQRWLKFVRYLRDEGFEADILTVQNPTYPIVDASLEAEIPAGTRVFKAKAWEPYALYAAIVGKKAEDVSKLTIRLETRGTIREGFGNWIRANFFIPDARMGWIYPLYREGLRLLKSGNYAGFVTTGPPHSAHVAGRFLQKKTGLYWLADMRDPWTRIHYNQLMPRSGFTKWLDGKLEKSVLTHADDVVVVSPGMKNEFSELYRNHYHILPNGFDTSDFPAAGTRPEGSFLMRHVGSLPESTLPFGFFEALSGLPQALNWRLEFIGNVHPEARVLVEKYRLEDRVFFLPYLPHEAAVQCMQEADVLCLFLAKTEGNRSIYSGKLFEYCGLEKPVFFVGSTDGDAAELLKKAGLGICHEHEDVTGIRHTLEGLIRGELSLPRPDAVQKQFIGNFSRQGLTRQLASVLRAGLAEEQQG